MREKNLTNKEIAHVYYDVFGPPKGFMKNVIRTRELLLTTLSRFSKPVGLNEFFFKKFLYRIIGFMG